MWFDEQYPGEAAAAEADDALATAIALYPTAAELALALERDEALLLDPVVKELVDLMKEQEVDGEADTLAAIEQKIKAAKGALRSASQPRGAC